LGLASFGVAKASNSRKFSPSKASHYTVFYKLFRIKSFGVGEGRKLTKSSGEKGGRLSHTHLCIKSRKTQTSTLTSLLEEGKRRGRWGLQQDKDCTLTLTEKMAPMSIL